MPDRPIFSGEASLQDFACTLAPADMERWIDLATHVAKADRIRLGAYPEKFHLELEIESKIMAALKCDLYRLSSDGRELTEIDWRTTRLRWSANTMEKSEPIAGREHRPDDWPVVQTWSNVTVRCTDTALARPEGGLAEIRRCPAIPVRRSSPVFKKRVLFLQFVVTESDSIVVGPRWLPAPDWLLRLITWWIRKTQRPA